MAIMPWAVPPKMTLSICCVRPSRIRFCIAGLLTITSKTAICSPSFRGISFCDTTALKTMDSCMRIWACCSAGNVSSIRSTVFEAPVVWRDESTRWPVSAAVIAVRIVSRSRISPSMITSGAWRSTARSARLKVRASFGTSLWEMSDLLCL